MRQPKGFELIINRPHHMAKSRRFADAGLTLVFWVLLLYLWQPLISIIAWVFKSKIFYNHMIVLGGIYELAQLALFYTIIILLLGGSLLVWAKVNQFRFRGKEKRKSIENVGIEKEAERYGVTAKTLMQWKNIKNSEVYFSEDGAPVVINNDKAPPDPKLQNFSI